MEDFTAVPNEWFDHLADGRLTVPMFTILTYLRSSCTWESGTWRGEAMRIWYGVGANANGEFIELRQMQKHLKRLGECGYITSHHVPGRRGGYKIDINNYVTKRGRGKDAEEITLRPTELKDLRDVPLSECAEEDAESNTESALTGRRECAESNTESACIQDSIDVQDGLDVPDALDLTDKGQVRKEEREKGSEASPPPSLSLEEKESVTKEEAEPLATEKWGEDPEVLDLVGLLNPMMNLWDTSTMSLEGGFAQRCVDHIRKLDYGRTGLTCGDLVIYNRIHKAPKNPKLLITSCQWLWEKVLKEGRGGNVRLVNEYCAHDCEDCRACQREGLVSFRVKQQTKRDEEAQEREAAAIEAWRIAELERGEKLARYEFRLPTTEEMQQFKALRQEGWPLGAINKMLTAETYPVARPAAWDERHVNAAILTCLQSNEPQTFESFTALVESIMELDKETPREMATNA